MKSNIYNINKELNNFNQILNEVEKVSVYNNLEKKQALRLRLLAEELTGMMKSLIGDFEGVFWIENDKLNYELHLELVAEKMNIDTRDKLIEFSKSGKNAAATGIMGKIRAVAEVMMLAVTEPGIVAPIGENNVDFYGINFGLGYVDPATILESGYMYTWSLKDYKSNAYKENKKEATDEFEKSIVANIADDIVIGVRGKKIDINIKKSF